MTNEVQDPDFGQYIQYLSRLHMFEGANPFLTWGTGVTVKHKNKFYKSVEKRLFLLLEYRWHSTEKFLTAKLENTKMFDIMIAM